MGSETGDNRKIVLFPFMSKGHIVPIIHLARHLLRRYPATTVTVITTPANRPFIDRSLSGTAASVISIPFPHGIPGIAESVESTDQLPSMSIFPAFALATAVMQSRFEEELEKLLPVHLLISDGFLWWTLESANKFGNIPRMAFYGMNNYVPAVGLAALAMGRVGHDAHADDEPFTVAAFPWIKVTVDSLGFPDPQLDPVRFDFVMKVIQSTTNSYGELVNSFEELEPAFLDYLNHQPGPKKWCVGPLCLVGPPEPVTDHDDKPTWARWLDRGEPVLYVAFGTQAEISPQQLKEIATGLEKSEAHFLWVMGKNKESELGDGFEERVKYRGLVVNGWVDQRTILMHPNVKGFMSHCGWNSVLESACAGVPILAWSMMAEQPLNAKMVEEELRIGMRIDGLPFKGGSGLVKWEEVERKVRELMEGERGKEARAKAEEVAGMARQVVEEGGSSWRNLDNLVKETCH